jgi:small subunit ribosomal protein S16
MAVVIRMRRTGRRNRPCYRINVADSRSPRDGSFLETLGTYDPISPVEESQLRLNVERARHWVSVGAKPSETVQSIFRKLGVYEGATERPARQRTGRARDTRTGERRAAEKAARAERKEARRNERAEARKAAAAGSGEGGEE